MFKHSFILEDYFLGQTRAFGLFVDRFGSVRRQFNIAINGEMEDETLVLSEDFAFDDGERSQRIWRITSLGNGRYSGTADDVIGEAIGDVTGNSFRWAYRLKLQMGGRDWHVHFDDLMVLQTEDILLNRATMSKFGITLGEVVIAFHKATEAAKQHVAEAAMIDTEAATKRRTVSRAIEAVPA